MSAVAPAGSAPAGSAGAARRPGQPAAAEADTGFFGGSVFRSLAQAFAIWLIMNTVTNYMKAKTVQHPATAQGSAAVSADGSTTAVGPTAAKQLQLVSVWPQGALLDVTVKLSTAEDGQVDFKDQSLPSVTWEGIEYSNSGWSKEWDTEFDVPKSVQHNASLWADVFVTRSGNSPNPSDTSYSSETLHVRKMLTRYYPYKKPRVVKNLMAGKKSTPEEEAAEAAAAEAEKLEVKPIVSYYHPNVTLQLVCNSGLVPYANLPPPLKEHVVQAKVGEFDAAGNGYHYPITYVNDFWLLREHMFPLNETTTRLPLKVMFSTSAHWKFQLLATLDDSFNKNAATGVSSGSELDEVKRMLTETSPYLLITTVVVTILHMLFEMLAFTSDVAHWRSKKDSVGVSLRTICTNVVVQLIILLYLLDNNENTSWMILFSQGTGLLIEAWKIQKVVDIKVLPANNLIGYRLDIKDKHVLSEEEKATKIYDELAFKWVSWATIPILGGYTIYSLFYNEHRGYYSFIVQTLTSFVYMFGFVQLVPQIIINHKLKSVAHIPMKALGYKFFSTIVDDFAAFIIRQPILHRIAAFRDDVVFLILMYQMYIYRVDPNRENEYGQKLTPEAAAELKAKQEAEAKGEVFETKKDK